MDEKFTLFADDIARNSMSGLQMQIEEIQKMEESQNFVLKDCHEKVGKMNKRLVELEKTDFDDKFNNITRKMIADVVRECLTPVQMAMNLDVKSIKKLVEEHAIMFESVEDALKQFRDDLEDFKLRNIYDTQNNKKEADSYLRELLRMQKLDHIRVQVTNRHSVAQQSWFNKTTDFNNAGSVLENESLTQDSLF